MCGSQGLWIDYIRNEESTMENNMGISQGWDAEIVSYIVSRWRAEQEET